MDPIITINLINAIHRRDKATSNAILNQLKKEYKSDKLGIAHEFSKIQTNINRQFSRNENIPDFLNHIETLPNLEHIFLDKTITQHLEQFIKDIKHKDELLKYHLPRTQTALFSGPSGFGKTSTALALGKELNLNTYQVEMSQLIDSKLGESAKNLKKLFDYIKQEPGLYVLDEFDSIGGDRNQYKHTSAVREEQRMVNSLLTYLDQGVGESVVIFTTNLKDTLDAALFRRIDLHLTFDSLTQKGYQEITQFYLRVQTLDEEVLKRAMNKTPAQIKHMSIQILKEMVYAGLNPNDPEQEANKLKRFKQLTKGV